MTLKTLISFNKRTETAIAISVLLVYCVCCYQQMYCLLID